MQLIEGSLQQQQMKWADTKRSRSLPNCRFNYIFVFFIESRYYMLWPKKGNNHTDDQTSPEMCFRRGTKQNYLRWWRDTDFWWRGMIKWDPHDRRPQQIWNKVTSHWNSANLYLDSRISSVLEYLYHKKWSSKIDECVSKSMIINVSWVFPPIHPS